MQVRFSTCRGAHLVEDASEEFIGTIVGVMIHPNNGTIEGFYVLVSTGLGTQTLFCATVDIIRFGRRVYVRHPEVLCDPYDIIRLQPLLEQPRPVLGQAIITQSGLKLGTCKDIQFDTDHFLMSWLFPRRFFRWGRPVPVSEIIEISPQRILVKDPPQPKVVAAAEPETRFEGVEVVEPKMSRSVD